ncbi:N-acetylglucosamine-specific PTS transporter subunit IIBC [Halalkalibacterium halodurans]|uniref:PTS system, n-acetylglucosamine-specific enzyme II, ABC component (EIIABC-Nag) n=1 Tax=Halalkalibacterium halodurans (strain ATCC BAA-125 / DSM 18197 / FERM 7344 / JCM 9153 / C-125) TaxID=272558 RepID=Q9KF24_HALH5|nr:N-acetylglucosamine-specific PTS transporter subunit IIBC [Halalkalibacterium halodurans]MED4083002.1 N-acetylglucosamine-specific PTS transporter subunit IIBC [Halalkalibacterium halodurans]MED4087117.1 N-acetylglucosamine-specific PTS transporter subunit IIBC [Halalkalibacterium halodurans]MED4105165.1 N-acetylglucosamine-specific PTS transporter subunit IIBC [Halalkalibacterium halodurans]MED4111175.1 N-acetylglucosamine-specific PTS transporter subunit IIBC [Halalkalibacterium halodurans
MLQFLQRIGRSLLLPIAALPVAGLLLRLGQEDLLNIPFMAAAGDALFSNLALLFAIGVAVGFAKDSHGAAALAGAIGFFVLTEGTQAINETINMGVLGGILSGVVAGMTYNRFKETKLPEWLAFFGGRRFVPIMTGLFMLVLAIFFGFVWPTVQGWLDSFGQWIIGAGATGVGVYGFFNRLLIPLGLHHVINTLVWFVFGEFNGATGDLHRFFAGDPNAGIFMAGFFPIMMFGLPAAALAMILAAKKEKRKATAGLLGGVAFTAFLTGITEPIEFTFMFLSPLLYGVHAVLTGTAMAVAYTLEIRHGFTFSAGAIDYFINFGIATKPWLLAFVGLIYAVIYFVLFYFLIIKLNLQTPGREKEESMDETETSSADYEEMAKAILAALGGKKNVKDLDFCVTRLRLTIHSWLAVDEKALRLAGAKGVVKLNDTTIQVVIGTDVEFVANAMKKRL